MIVFIMASYLKIVIWQQQLFYSFILILNKDSNKLICFNINIMRKSHYNNIILYCLETISKLTDKFNMNTLR